jgi:predicted RNase H-like HicB family nuclease
MTTKIKVKTRELKFKIPIIVEFDTVNYHAYSPALKGFHMDGETEEEALNNAKLTAGEFLRIMIEDGIPIPVSTLVRTKKRSTTAVDKKGYFEEDISVSL